MTTSVKEIAEGMKHRFPMLIPELKDTKVSSQSYWVGVSEAQLSLNPDAPEEAVCQLSAVVAVRSEVVVSGFAGAAYYDFKDERGNIIYALLGDGMGVNGTGVFGKDSRKEKQVKNVPIEVAAKTYSVSAFPCRVDEPGFDDIKHRVDEFAKTLEGMKESLKSIGASAKEIIGALKGG